MSKNGRLTGLFIDTNSGELGVDAYYPLVGILCSRLFGKSSIPHCYYYSAVCLTTGPKPPPKRFLHIVRSKASSFKWKYPLLSLRSSSIFLRLLPRLLVTSISPFIFPSITCFRRQFLRKMWPIQLAFRFRISRRFSLYNVFEDFSKQFRERSKFNWNLTRLTGTSHGDVMYIEDSISLTSP